jgi:Cu-Zn family superoxide dismutase
MKRIVFSLLSSAAFAAGAAEPQSWSAAAAFVDVNGREIGAATLKETPHGVLIEAHLDNLPPGEHAFHIHETGKCETATQFKSAGDHYAPRSRKHGYLAQGGPHAGDMPNQFAGKDGMLHASALNTQVTLSKGPATLFDADGSSLIVHAKRDDYASQPSGDAGDRIACAVVKRIQATGSRPQATGKNKEAG